MRIPAWLVVLPLTLSALASAQTSAPSLRDLARHSGYIFSGTVERIAPVQPNKPGGAPAVQITFRVTDAIRGTRAGELLTIREWAGLWTTGDRYQIGERVMLFLHRPSKLGLTSPVAGVLGRFFLNRKGEVQIDERLRRPLLPGGSFSANQHNARSAAVPYKSFAKAVRRVTEVGHE